MKTPLPPQTPTPSPHAARPSGIFALHRIAALYTLVGAYMFALWLIAVSCGKKFFAYYTLLQYSWVGDQLLFLWVFSMFFHLTAGWCYLLYSAGIGHSPFTTRRSVYITVFIGFLVTSAVWLYTLGL